MTGMAGGTGWVLDAVTVDGEDALDTPLEVEEPRRSLAWPSR